MYEFDRPTKYSYLGSVWITLKVFFKVLVGVRKKYPTYLILEFPDDQLQFIFSHPTWIISPRN